MKRKPPPVYCPNCYGWVINEEPTATKMDQTTIKERNITPEGLPPEIITTPHINYHCSRCGYEEIHTEIIY